MIPNPLHSVLFLSDKPMKLNAWIVASQKAGIHVLTKTIESVEDCESVDVGHADLIVEWCSLTNNLKPDVLAYLAQTTPADVPILTACWERPATTLGKWAELESRVVGFSPLCLLQGTQGVTLSAPFAATLSSNTFDRISSFFSTLNLKSYWLAKDTPVGVAPRIWAMLVNEAAFALQEGVATAADIDTAMKLGTNYPMGPCEWADLVGVDTVLEILDTVWSVYREERYRPCWLLQQMVQIGHTGKQCGRGFYDYATQPQSSVIPSNCSS